MKCLIASLLLSLSTLCSPVYSKVADYNGEVTFKSETNMPGVNIEGNSKVFRVLKAEFSDDNLSLKKIEAEIDAETLKTGIELRDHHMYEKVFYALSGNEKPALLKMVMDKSTCEKNGEKLNCSGIASFTFGKKNFTRKLELKFDNKLGTEVAFNVSLKELALEIPSYLGIELEDAVSVKMKASKR